MGILVGTRFVDMLFGLCEQGLSYCRRLRDAIDANRKVAEGDPELRCWFFDKPYSNMCFLRGKTHWGRTPELKTRRLMAMCNSVFVGWHNLKMSAVPPKVRLRHYVTVPTFWKTCEASRLLYLPSRLMVAYYSGTFDDNARRFGYLLLETAITESSIMLSVCFISASEYSVANIFFTARPQALAKDGCSKANKRVLAPVPYELLANTSSTDHYTVLETVRLIMWLLS